MANNTRKYNKTSVEEDITEIAKSYTMYQIGKLQQVIYAPYKSDIFLCNFEMHCVNE